MSLRGSIVGGESRLHLGNQRVQFIQLHVQPPHGLVIAVLKPRSLGFGGFQRQFSRGDLIFKLGLLTFQTDEFLFFGKHQLIFQSIPKLSSVICANA